MNNFSVATKRCSTTVALEICPRSEKRTGIRLAFTAGVFIASDRPATTSDILIPIGSVFTIYGPAAQAAWSVIPLSGTALGYVQELFGDIPNLY